MKHRFLVLIGTLAVVGAVFAIHTATVEAACECIRKAPPATTVHDSQGIPIPNDAFGTWESTPITNPEEPLCPPSVAPPGGWKGCYTDAAGDPQPGELRDLCPCNVYTQGFVRTWFRVPTLGDLIGNALRLIFFIAGLYALVLLLLGGFEWVSSGGDDKKLSSARGKIINAIVGLVVMVAVLTLVILLEQVVFGGKVCLGISCPINMGDLRLIGR